MQLFIRLLTISVSESVSQSDRLGLGCGVTPVARLSGSEPSAVHKAAADCSFRNKPKHFSWKSVRV